VKSGVEEVPPIAPRPVVMLPRRRGGSASGGSSLSRHSSRLGLGNLPFTSLSRMSLACGPAPSSSSRVSSSQSVSASSFLAALRIAEDQAAQGYARAIERTRVAQDEATGNYVRIMNEVARLRTEFESSCVAIEGGVDEGASDGDYEDEHEE